MEARVLLSRQLRACVDCLPKSGIGQSGGFAAAVEEFLQGGRVCFDALREQRGGPIRWRTAAKENRQPALRAREPVPGGLAFARVVAAVEWAVEGVAVSRGKALQKFIQVVFAGDRAGEEDELRPLAELECGEENPEVAFHHGQEEGAIAGFSQAGDRASSSRREVEVDGGAGLVAKTKRGQSIGPRGEPWVRLVGRGLGEVAGASVGQGWAC